MDNTPHFVCEGPGLRRARRWGFARYELVCVLAVLGALASLLDPRVLSHSRPGVPSQVHPLVAADATTQPVRPSLLTPCLEVEQPESRSLSTFISASEAEVSAALTGEEPQVANAPGSSPTEPAATIPTNVPAPGVSDALGGSGPVAR